MTPTSSRQESEDPTRRVKVILIGEVEAESLGEGSAFEIHRCEDVKQATQFWGGSEASVSLVDLECLSDERANLRKQMAQFQAVLVLAIADSIDDKTCEKLLRMGCVGFLRRREAPATIERALKAVLAGELWFPRTTLSRVLRGFLVGQDPDRLTSREQEILALISGNLNNQEIADKLFISRETVRWHIKSLHAKLGTRTRRSLGDQVRLINRLSKAIPAQRAPGKSQESRAS